MEDMKATTARDKIVLIVERDNTDSEVFGPFATREAAEEAFDEALEKGWDEHALTSHIIDCRIITMQQVPQLVKACQAALAALLEEDDDDATWWELKDTLEVALREAS